MELRLLEYFMAVCEELHFTRAAENLGISQPTLSQQIRLLEGRVGSQRFFRSGKKIYITEEGKILLNRAKRIFSEIEQASLEINQLKGIQRGKLTIGCSGNHNLYPYMVSFHEKYPNIELSVHDTTTKETIEKIMERDFDLGVVFLPVEHSQLKTIPLFKRNLSIAVSHNHPLSHQKEIELKELQETPLFLLQKKYLIRQDIDRYCEERGIFLKPLIELTDIESLLRMTILYNGVTILPTSYLELNTEKNFHIIHIADSIPKRDVGVIYQNDAHLSATQKAFIDHLLEIEGKEISELLPL